MGVKIGDAAPNFSGATQDGEISLSDFTGKKLALYFYPKDNTPGCTNQACSLRDEYADLKESGIAIVGVSTDSVKSHAKFASGKSLPFPLISDPDHTVHELFGTWALKKFMGREYMGTLRQTFLIDESGTVVDIIEKPNTKDHGNEVLERFRALG